MSPGLAVKLANIMVFGLHLIKFRYVSVKTVRQRRARCRNVRAEIQPRLDRVRRRTIESGRLFASALSGSDLRRCKRFDRAVLLGNYLSNLFGR